MDFSLTVPVFSDQLLTAMDFKFELDTKPRKFSLASASKKGKRGLPFGFSLSPKEESETDGTTSAKTPTSPPKSRRSGGWAGETLKSAIRRSSSAFFEQEQLDQRALKENDDIPVIPNLDDYDDDDIAKAPMVSHKMASFKELELDLLKHSSFASLEDVNLRILTPFIQSQQALEEPDIQWTRDSLFSDLFAYQHEHEFISK